MEIINSFFIAIYDLSNAMAPYILFGLIFAGILHELIPSTFVMKHLGSDSIGSVVKSTLFGIPLPVCSCGVIPLASSIKKNGASNGSTLSFLIATPITGIDSILATYGMFGWAFTLYRVFTSVLMAIVAGILTNLYGSDEKEHMAIDENTTKVTSTSITPNEKSCSSDSCGCTEESVAKKFSLTASLEYAFVTLLGDIAKPLFWGLVIGAFIAVATPQNLHEILVKYNWISYLVTIAIALPMYVCATASLPIAAGLLLAGVSPGAAFVFLSAGPATNTVTIGIVKKLLGTKALVVYLGTIIGGSLFFGFGLDYLFLSNEINVLEMIHMDEEAGLLQIFSSVLLWGFVLYFLITPFFHKKENMSCGSSGSYSS